MTHPVQCVWFVGVSMKSLLSFSYLDNLDTYLVRFCAATCHRPDRVHCCAKPMEILMQSAPDWDNYVCTQGAYAPAWGARLQRVGVGLVVRSPSHFHINIKGYGV